MTPPNSLPHSLLRSDFTTNEKGTFSLQSLLNLLFYHLDENNITFFPSTKLDSPQATPKSQKADSPSIDYAELLRHFEKVQKKHLEVRHQRSGRGDHLDRRVVL